MAKCSFILADEQGRQGRELNRGQGPKREREREREGERERGREGGREGERERGRE